MQVEHIVKKIAMTLWQSKYWWYYLIERFNEKQSAVYM